jgi:hypothetical protein
MGRNATIAIWNLTDGDFDLEGTHTEHGKFHRKPPEVIKKGDKESFGVGNRTGAKIGPKGTVTYKTTQRGETFKIIFFWDHPFGHTSSSYTCHSEPLGKIKAVLSPNHPTGHNQSVTWTVENT